MTAARVPPPADTKDRSSALPPRAWRRALRLVTTLRDWAESGWSKSATAVWGALQGSIVPGPADGLLIPLGLADPPRAYTLALWTLVGSVAGGIGAYLLGAHAFDELGHDLLAWVGIGAQQLHASRALFDQYGGAVVALSALLPVPTKMMCIAAGVFGVPFAEFAAGIAAGRAVRFLAVATVLRYAGERLMTWLGTPRVTQNT